MSTGSYKARILIYKANNPTQIPRTQENSQIEIMIGQTEIMQQRFVVSSLIVVLCLQFCILGTSALPTADKLSYIKGTVIPKARSTEQGCEIIYGEHLKDKLAINRVKGQGPKYKNVPIESRDAIEIGPRLMEFGCQEIKTLPKNDPNILQADGNWRVECQPGTMIYFATTFARLNGYPINSGYCVDPSLVRTLKIHAGTTDCADSDATSEDTTTAELLAIINGDRDSVLNRIKHSVQSAGSSRQPSSKGTTSFTVTDIGGQLVQSANSVKSMLVDTMKLGHQYRFCAHQEAGAGNSMLGIVYLPGSL